MREVKVLYLDKGLHQFVLEREGKKPVTVTTDRPVTPEYVEEIHKHLQTVERR